MALSGIGAPDNPMVDSGHVKKLISELPANDFVQALTDISGWLKLVSGANGLGLSRRFEIIDLLDGAAQHPYRKLNDEYQSAQRMQKFRENTLWTAASEFAKLLGDAYGQCIEEFGSDVSGADTIRSELSEIVARALRALTLQMKWAQLRYIPIDTRIWDTIGRLYLFAETKGICTEAVKTFPDAHGDSTVQREFLNAMILGVSSNNGLDPAQQEIAARAVAHFGSHYALQMEPAPGCNFCFDLAQHEPPARATKDFVSGKTMRCFGAGVVQATLAAMIREIRQSDSVPEEIGAGFDADLVISVLRHLAIQWADELPARRSERRRIATRLTVLHGFAELVRAAESAMDTASLDFEHAAGIESWVVENVSWIVENLSERGFGAIIPPVQGDWIKVGTLLGVQTDASRVWGAGIIRRIERDESLQRHVGIQILAKTAIPVKLLLTGTEATADATRTGESALLLSATPDKDGEVSLLVQAGSNVRNHPLEMRVLGKRLQLTPRNPVEGRDDFDWVKFKIMARVE